jgi:hypothetical protein
VQNPVVQCLGPNATPRMTSTQAVMEHGRAEDECDRMNDGQDEVITV